MIKGKSNVKNFAPRRTAGLQIKAALEPRRDSGTNLASEIFGAVREEQESKLQKAQKVVQTSVTVLADDQESAKSIAVDAVKNSQKVDDRSSQNLAVETAAGASLIRSGDGQMRTVSLQQSNRRKIIKQPKKPLQILSGGGEIQKIPLLFERTKAEELYDLLHQLTLGADEPCECVRVRRSDLMASTNIKTRLTLDLNLKRLEENQLLKIESRPGEQEGNIYTVFPLPR